MKKKKLFKKFFRSTATVIGVHTKARLFKVTVNKRLSVSDRCGKTVIRASLAGGGPSVPPSHSVRPLGGDGAGVGLLGGGGGVAVKVTRGNVKSAGLVSARE